MGLRHALLLAAGVFALTACSGGGKISGDALSNGDWGWKNGKACAGLADVWRVSDTSIIQIRDGAETDKFRVVSREPEYSERSPGRQGRLEGLTWVYDLTDPATGKTIRRRDYFSVSYTSVSGFKGLIFGTSHDRSETGKYKKVKTGRKIGDRLVPCAPA
ncbi:MAG: hypothetical protein KDA53_10295 [Hyphomonas sp.]|nr:hypothetical protein [Hyphomonas sp.]